ncbi:MarR family winged helix-turn-helix transcriptional regulator [Gordonia neofelifaecis]|uniref:Transcriptional regulator n=1 Tax=Gordonia neofelifaecis NRRL B-59395 TaxID=644548 RepID=F1YPX3_9ACTN|nr:MarR family transcriptional regulator [Gordonia neofelifaecis]EGD53262.1 transcriptional regulator [Gordonia neofelifaecis NRRL B-59395]
MTAAERPADDGPIGGDDVADAVLTASRLLVSLSAKSIAQVDDSITIAQFRVLVLLSNSGPMNLASLAHKLSVQPSTASRMIDRLAHAELVERAPSAQTRRELIVVLTERGAATVRDVTDRRRDEIEQVISHLSRRQRQDLVRALTAFSEAGDEPAVSRTDGMWA